MGIAITELLPRKEIDISYLNNKKIAIDTSLFLYQFLSTIRQRDGTLLTDSQGRVTSHLIGLFNRTTSLMHQGLQMFFVFDGQPPLLKKAEQDRRAGIKEQAAHLHRQAEAKGHVDDMKKYASRTSKLTSQMLDEAEALIKALGLPVIHAPSEAEAQAAHIIKKGHGYAMASQDADSLMFGAPRMIRNLTISQRKKMPGQVAYAKVKPEMVVLDEVLNSLGLDISQLIALAMLIGTDYNVGGIKGIGPKKALQLVKKHGTDFETLFKDVDWDKSFDLPWTDIYYAIKKMPVSDDYTLQWKPVDKDKVIEMLVDGHDFDGPRVSKTLDKFIDNKQKGLGDFI